ncbi:MAG TPA: ABC transporter permease [Termitinemataceae bacterium]|nr:ABC transporter permease [Termitinemataceae bacterium]HOM23105.1 ABC transporter permease [Termitinemataceae bacterium]HPP99955.1 ABC transporter permease [Termitinemataceae bacterium]
MKRREQRRIVVPLVAVLLGFLVGALVIIVTGRSPAVLFISLIRTLTGMDPSGASDFNPRYVGEFIVQALPIILTGLSVAFAFRTGLFNIGAEGQLMVGSLAAVTVALLVKAPPLVHPLLCLLAAMAAGALWGLIPGYLKARFNVHEVVVSIMMNYTALHFVNWALLQFGSVDRVKTPDFPPTATLKSVFLSSITNGSRLNWGIIPVVLALLFFWFIIEKTTFGYRLRAVGFNKEGARYAGMRVELNIMLSMMIAGAFAGLAGAVITLGTFNFGRVLPAFEGYGMDGIAVALVGANHAGGVLFSGLLFGLLKAAQPLMQSQGIPREISQIIQASIVLFIAMRLGIEMLLSFIGSNIGSKGGSKGRARS